MFKTPLDLVIVSHNPERDFIFKLIGNAKYINSWIKSRDKGFYSVGYEFWKGGKDRMRRSFNPDFFIKNDIQDYIDRILADDPDAEVSNLMQMQDNGITEIIHVVEIKSDEDRDETTSPKGKYSKEHFESVNKRLREINPFDLPPDFQNSTSQYYTFDLLTPDKYTSWFNNLKKGILE